MQRRQLTIALALSLTLNALLLYNVVQDGPVATPRDAPTPQDTPADILESGKSYPLMRVVDGDTLTVGFDGKTEYVRLIGIDTPEPNDPGGPECYATEATAHLRELARSGTIVLNFDDTQGTRDRYERLLAYVELPSGTDLGEQMLRDGYAREYTYAEAYARQDAYRSAENEALQEERGLWASDVCAPPPSDES